MEETPKKIEVVNGNGDELDISEVKEYLKVAKPKTKDEKNKKIIIPEEKK